MSSVFTSTRLRRRSLEGVAWIAGIGLSVILTAGVYTTAAAPFRTIINDDTALPKELATTSNRYPVPLPAILSPKAAPSGEEVVNTYQTAANASSTAPAAPQTATSAPSGSAQLAPGATTVAPAAPSQSAPSPVQNQAQPAGEQRAEPQPQRSAPTQAPATTPTTAAQAQQPPRQADNNLSPIIDPVTGLVRGTLQGGQQ